MLRKKCKDAAYSVLYLCLWDEVKKLSEYSLIVIIQYFLPVGVYDQESQKKS